MSPPTPIVFFTGAGISVGSGLRTYRGRDGLYENSDLQPPHADDVSTEGLPGLWARFRPRLDANHDVRPSAAHQAIAAFEGRGPTRVVTQNVDGLHTLAGNADVVELHGTLRTVRCLPHSHRTPIDDVQWGPTGVPTCPTCDGPCRPDVVLFGEALPEHAWQDASRIIRRAASVVAVGTSAQVFPAAGLISAHHVDHAIRIWVNPEHPPPDPGWTWLDGTADDEVVRLLA